eukprot:3815882-Pleurochrysis_carterae.AAC.1
MVRSGFLAMTARSETSRLELLLCCMRVRFDGSAAMLSQVCRLATSEQLTRTISGVGFWAWAGEGRPRKPRCAHAAGVARAAKAGRIPACALGAWVD